MRRLVDRGTLATAAALLLVACAGSSESGQTERPSAPPPDDCDSTCPEELIDRYAETLLAGTRGGEHE